MKQYVLSLGFLILFTTAGFAQSLPIILDADTGNEMDDFYAIVKAVRDPGLEVTALISGHFNNAQLLTDSLWHIYPTAEINTVQISQAENEKLLRSLKREDIPHPIGSDRMVGYAWGQYQNVPPPQSAGTDYIVAQARQASPDNKLVIVSLGAATNVAAAILTDTTIARNIRLYALNMKLDIDRRVWSKNSFNARNDTNGLDVLLNTRDLELYLMPGNVSKSLVFDRQRSLKELATADDETNQILTQRWDEVGSHTTHIMWDVALIEAILHPEFATLETMSTPPENTQRNINVYTAIKPDQMEADFWKSF